MKSQLKNGEALTLVSNNKRKADERIDNFEIEMFKTPVKKSKRLSLDFLTNTEKSIVYQQKANTTSSKIASFVQRDKKTVKSFLKKVKKTGSFASLNQNKGRYKRGDVKLNERQKGLLRKWLVEESMSSVRQCVIRLNKVRNLPYASYKSVNTYIKSLGGFVRLKLKSIISEKNKAKRLAFCENRKEFNFKKVLFTDESCFQMNSVNRKAFRFKGQPPPRVTKYNPNYSIMVWGGISYQGKTTLHFIEGKIKAKNYQEILIHKSPDIRKLFRRRGRWYFQQDNAPCHRPNWVKNWIKEFFSCELLDHPAQSPDLNPIELIWALMKKEIEINRPTSKAQLKIAVQKSWNNITIAQIRKCIDNLKCKMNKIVQCNGDL